MAVSAVRSIIPTLCPPSATSTRGLQEQVRLRKGAHVRCEAQLPLVDREEDRKCLQLTFVAEARKLLLIDQRGRRLTCLCQQPIAALLGLGARQISRSPYHRSRSVELEDIIPRRRKA